MLGVGEVDTHGSSRYLLLLYLGMYLCTVHGSTAWLRRRSIGFLITSYLGTSCCKVSTTTCTFRWTGRYLRYLRYNLRAHGACLCAADASVRQIMAAPSRMLWALSLMSVLLALLTLLEVTYLVGTKITPPTCLRYLPICLASSRLPFPFLSRNNHDSLMTVVTRTGNEAISSSLARTGNALRPSSPHFCFFRLSLLIDSKAATLIVLSGQLCATVARPFSTKYNVQRLLLLHKSLHTALSEYHYYPGTSLTTIVHSVHRP